MHRNLLAANKRLNIIVQTFATAKFTSKFNQILANPQHRKISRH